ncbi:MAG: hypothetical protein HYZ54_07880 [Ignavibacteriae bacterium]|nr:hypothetical protein [Ignavibacteriota bacterium]
MKHLYRIIALAVLILGISSTDCSAWYRLSAKNGGPEGYGNIVVHWDQWGTDTRCEYSGNNKCPTEAKREKGFLSREVTIDIKDQEAANYAFDQMRKGIKEGNSKRTSGRFVSWKRTSTDIYVLVK